MGFCCLNPIIQLADDISFQTGETTYLYLVTGEHRELPEGALFDPARKQSSGWIVKFRSAWEEDEPMYQLFGHLFYDADGNEYEINRWSSMYGDAGKEGNITYFYDEFPLKNTPTTKSGLVPIIPTTGRQKI